MPAPVLCKPKETRPRPASRVPFSGLSPNLEAALLARDGGDGATLPAHLLCVECFQANDGGDVNLREPRQLRLVESS